MREVQRVPAFQELQIDGAVNFRCVQLSARGGSRLKSGFLFRSGTLSSLSDAGILAVDRLGIRKVIDLRSNAERLAHPSPVVSALGLRDVGMRHDIRHGNLAAVLKDARSAPDDIRREMLEMYRVIPYAFAGAFSHAICQLLGLDAPALIHCSAGKDRTGILVALILAAIGCSRDEIVEDYERTAAYRHQIIDDLTHRANGFFGRLRPNILTPLVEADGTYLEAMFQELDTRSGGVSRYLKSINIGPAEISRLESALRD